MAWDSSKAIKRNDAVEPIPQVWDEVLQDYVVYEGFIKFDGLSEFNAGAVTISAGGTESALQVTASAAMTNRAQLILYPPAAGTVYWGPPGVTSASGAPISAGDPPAVFDFLPSNAVAVYAVSDGTEREVRVVESK